MTKLTQLTWTWFRIRLMKYELSTSIFSEHFTLVRVTIFLFLGSPTKFITCPSYIFSRAEITQLLFEFRKVYLNYVVNGFRIVVFLSVLWEKKEYCLVAASVHHKKIHLTSIFWLCFVYITQLELVNTSRRQVMGIVIWFPGRTNLLKGLKHERLVSYGNLYWH